MIDIELLYQNSPPIQNLPKKNVLVYKKYRIFPKYGPGVNYFQMVIRPGAKLNQAFFWSIKTVS